MLIESLKNKTAKERAQIKSKELAKIKIGKFKKDDLEIEIIGDIKAIEINGSHGIEFFAKAWKNNKQLGFSKDGSVEIERFRIYNPPVLVDDENGDIIREWTDEITGELKQRKLKENSEEAIKQSLAHTIGLVGKENTNIIKGKIGNTTSTFYSDAGSGDPNTTFDAWAAPTSTTPYSAVRDAENAAWCSNAGTHATDTMVSNDYGGVNYDVRRSMHLFDTSSLSGQQVNSATLSIYPYTAKSVNDADSISVVAVTPASNNIMVVADWGQFGSIKQATDITISSWSTSAYNVFTLNATGISNVVVGGITKFGLRTAKDIANTTPTGLNRVTFYMVDQTGTTNDPKLVVVHSAVETFTGDAAIVTLHSTTFTSNASLKSIESTTFTGDASLRSIESTTFTGDSNLKSIESVTFISNANLKKEVSTNFTSDSNLKREIISATFTGDSILVTTITETFTGDANLIGSESTVFTSNANLKGENISNIFTSNAAIITLHATTFTGDAIITPKDKTYSSNNEASLPADDTNLEYLFTTTDYTSVSADDSEYAGQAVDSTDYSIFQFKEKKLSQDSFRAEWIGQSTLAPSVSEISLQVYNRTSGLWETMDSDSITAADTDFTLESEQLTNLNNYYNVDNWLSFRVIQQNS